MTEQAVAEVQFVGEIAKGLGRKFEVTDMNGDLYEAAMIYAWGYEGDFPFMRDMAAAARRGKLSDGQAKGVLNCMAAEARRQEAAAAAPVAQPVANAKPVPDGVYAIPVDGHQVIVRIEHPQWGNFGPDDQVASRPGYEHAWESFASVSHGTVHPFRRATDQLLAALTALLTAADPLEYGFAYSLLSGKCWVCGTVLDDPVSVKCGIGPVCAKKLGIDRIALSEDEAFKATITKLVARAAA